MIFKKIGNMENVEVICHYYPWIRIDLWDNRAVNFTENSAHYQKIQLSEI
jgi:hypothetical protein